MKKLLLCVALAISLCALSQTARADVYTSANDDIWSYNVTAQITGYLLRGETEKQTETGKFYDSRDSRHYSNLSSDRSTLAWGHSRISSVLPASESKITLSGTSGDNYVADGTPIEAVKLVHNNRTISSDTNFPTVIDLSMNFSFTKDFFDEKGNLEDTLTLTETVNLFMGFTETLNSTSYPDDVFYFLNPLEGFTNRPIMIGDDPSGYMLTLTGKFDLLEAPEREGQNGYYKIAFDALNAMNDLDNQLNWGDAIYGWITKENGTSNSSNSFSISFKFDEDPDNPPRDPGDIDPTPTPEPATMLIFGLGIAGGLPLALRRRRNRN